MKVLVQRSNEASVLINGKIKKTIDNGLVLLVGFCEGDNEEKIDYIVKKIVNLRIFPDDKNVMNKSILEYGGEILSISQFTLYADTKKGNRPSYIKALRGELSKDLYDLFNKKLSELVPVKTGEFGSDMLVSITNVGPTTIILER